ncbi:uncharacterized protein LOC143193216 isoform X2 [Rhynchophorus ferrugineus]|uniref:uncharacterized protein LOC143193216 isoform X2 n=1 Tax=Rhynchophorus ferrugineus TaxID=354439 RepID=UPI003FCE6414
MAHFRRPFTLLIGAFFLGPCGGQFFGASPQPQQNLPVQLSPQQQGQILSDVQQHQHRFDLQQRGNAGVHQPQLFNRNQQLLAQSGLFGGQSASQFSSQPQQAHPPIFRQNGPTVQQSQLPTAQAQISNFASPTNPSIGFQSHLTPEPQKNSIIFPSSAPSLATPPGLLGQHHTQTGFTPNFIQQVTQRNPFVNTRPTADPIDVINEQLKHLDPSKDQQRIKELQDKKTIIEKHNQFVEKQYDIALKKAREEHQTFLETQREQKKKLYQTLLTRPPTQRVTQSLPRRIYPEEHSLFEKSLQQYYREHPTTTTTTTTTTTPKPTTQKSNKKTNQKAFLPTALPSITSSKIQSLDDLDLLKKQYKQQQINKSDLLAQLRAAISSTAEEDSPKNLSSREISLADGKKVQLIETSDPKLIPNGKEEEITLPNGDKVFAIRADKSLLSGTGLKTDAVGLPAGLTGKEEEITLPNGDKVIAIKADKNLLSNNGLKNDAVGLPAGLTGKEEEITLPNGDKVIAIKADKNVLSQTLNPDLKTSDIGLPSGLTGNEEEITLPNGDKVIAIKADKNLLSRAQASKGDEITLPNGQKVQVIQTTKDGKDLKDLSGQDLILSNLAGQKEEIFKTSSSSAPASYKTQEITLPNGEKVEVIKTTDPKLVPDGVPLQPGSDLEKLILSKTTTSTPPKVVLDELKKVVPPGANVDFLKSGAGGNLENIALPKDISNQKKVTFVLLEEQSDGTLKIQGVKGNGKDKSELDLDSILKKIKAGEIKLPGTTTTPEPELAPSSQPGVEHPKFITNKPISVTVSPNSFAGDDQEHHSSTTKPLRTSVADDSNLPILTTNIGSHFVSLPPPSPTRNIYTTPSDLFKSNSGSPSPTNNIYPTSNDIYSSTTTSSPFTSPEYSNSKEEYFSNNRYTTPDDIYRISSRSPSLSSSYSTSNTIYNSITKTTPTPKYENYETTRSTYYTTPKTHKASIPPPKPTASTSQSQTSASTPLDYSKPRDQHSKKDINGHLPDLTSVLKAKGLYAMARFLKQSGLDTVLNDTGPYTVFAPTDKAFRTLLVQLGGPERAEEKFKENPRLLSGLLLHHVIPGAFAISSLQDEMTGVSLAGTQLRVNQYNMHDNEWNDVKVTTINGARIIEEQQDIPIPQGIAHAIDRVMFPLPVGDLVQTMQADRERRFTNFLRAVFASGMAETLQGSKSLTLFAPTDKAFAGLSSSDLNQTVTDPALAKELVMKHLIHGTLYTNGMRYYQVKDSLKNDAQITISKHSGKIKVNNQGLITTNIPATNGVIHAVDTLL